jgi:hypothetical protein
MSVLFISVLWLYFNNIFFLLKTVIKEVINSLIISLIHFNNKFDI